MLKATANALVLVAPLTSILATQVDIPELTLPFFLTTQISSEYGSRFKDLAYDFTSKCFWCMKNQFQRVRHGWRRSC